MEPPKQPNAFQAFIPELAKVLRCDSEKHLTKQIQKEYAYLLNRELGVIKENVVGADELLRKHFPEGEDYKLKQMKHHYPGDGKWKEVEQWLEELKLMRSEQSDRIQESIKCLNEIRMGWNSWKGRRTYPYEPTPFFDDVINAIATKHAVPSEDSEELLQNIEGFRHKPLSRDKVDPVLHRQEVEEILGRLPFLGNGDLLNVYGEVGVGRSKLLQTLKYRIRDDEQLQACDCWIRYESLRVTPEKELQGQLAKRLERGIEESRWLELGEAELPETRFYASRLKGLRDYVVRKQGKIICLLDDGDKLGPDLQEKIHFLRKYVDVIIVTSRRPVTKANMLPLDVCSMAESFEYLTAHNTKLSDNVREEVRSQLNNPHVRKPTVLREYLRKALHAPSLDVGDVKRIFEQAENKMKQEMDSKLHEIFQRNEIDPELRYEFTAPLRLTEEHILEIFGGYLGRTEGDRRVANLLVDLYEHDYVDSDPTYGWVGFVKEKVLEDKREPSNETMLRLIEWCQQRAQQQEAEKGERFLASLEGCHYLVKSQVADDVWEEKACELIEAMYKTITDLMVLPDNQEVYPILKTATKAEKPKVARRALLLLFRFYLDRLDIPKAETTKEELEKFELTQEERRYCSRLELELFDRADVVRLSEKVEIITRTEKLNVNKLPIDILYFKGRALQARDNLSNALKVYREVVRNKSKQKINYRVSALIQCATIYIFAEEANEARGMLEKAEREIADGGRDARTWAHFYRYWARVEKLSENDDRAEDYAKLSEKASGDWEEGVLWAKVVYGRREYFREDFSAALDILTEVFCRMEDKEYRSGLVHVLRHLMLVHAGRGKASEVLETFEKAKSVSGERLYVKALLFDSLAKAKAILNRSDQSRAKDDIVECLVAARNLYSRAGLYSEEFKQLPARIERAIQQPSRLLPPDRMPW